MANQTESRAYPSLPPLADTLSLRNERLFLFTLLLSIAPLWIGPYLPLVDLPQHAAQITALRQLINGDTSFSELFRINWFTPYLLGNLLLYPLTWLMPITVATKLVLSVAVGAIPPLTGKLLRSVGADEGWKWLAIPCSFSFAFYWGFLPYVLSVPLVLLFLIETVRFVTAPTVGRSFAIAAFSILLFFCHVIAMGFASLIALGYVVGAHYRDWRLLALRALPYTAPIPLIGAWMASNYVSDARIMSGSFDLITFGPLSYRLMQLVAQPAGTEELLLAIPLVALVTGVVLIFPKLAGARLSRDPKRWLPLALGLTAFLFGPHFVLDTAYFYQRLGVFLVPLWLMAWDLPHSKRRLDWLAMSVVTVWVVTNGARFVAFARESESFSNVVAAMEPERYAAAMVVDKNSPRFGLPVYLHFAAWYQAMHGGIVDFNFADFYSQMVQYRLDAGARVSETVLWFPSEFDWEVHGGDGYDYFLIKAGTDVSAEIFKERQSSVELITSSGWWWLYRNVEPPSGRRAARPNSSYTNSHLVRR